jgi:hypothetical protein
MPITVGSQELDAIGDHVAAQYYGEMRAKAKYQSEINEVSFKLRQLREHRTNAKIILGLSTAIALIGVLTPLPLGPWLVVLGLMAAGLAGVWIYDSFKRESRFLAQQKFAVEGLRRLTDQGG